MKLPLSPYRKTLALKRQIETAQAQIRRLESATHLDRAMCGLKACARAKVTFDYDGVNANCVNGLLIGPINGYDVARLFGFEDQHAYIHTETDGMHISIYTNDGVVSIQISLQKPKDKTKVFPLDVKLKAACAFLRKSGVKMTTERLQTKRNAKAAEVSEMDTLIAEVNP